MYSSVPVVDLAFFFFECKKQEIDPWSTSVHQGAEIWGQRYRLAAGRLSIEKSLRQQLFELMKEQFLAQPDS